MKETLHLAVHSALLGMLFGCVTPPADRVVSGQPILPAPPASRADETKTVTLVGLLTRKGPDIESWWALTADDGVVWKLEASNPGQDALLQRWQNSHARINGVTAGFMLAIPILKVKQIELLH
jgi:hypothetical protein